jgi:hypothetical protein
VRTVDLAQRTADQTELTADPADRTVGSAVFALDRGDPTVDFAANTAGSTPHSAISSPYISRREIAPSAQEAVFVE